MKGGWISCFLIGQGRGELAMTSSIFVAGDVVNYHQKDGRVIDEELAEIVRGADYSDFV